MIRFESLTKRYGAHRAVEDLDLSVRGGEVVALIGPNGSGKSTSLEAAAGLVRPTSGRVLAGEPGTSTQIPATRRLISFLPQRVSFPGALTGSEIVEFYRRLRGATPEVARNVLRTALLNGAADRATRTYSGGMIQRLGLAVVALPDARVFLLDEPTASLDAEGLGAFHSLVRRWRAEGRAVLFSSHLLGDAERVADRIAVLVNGRLAAVLGQGDLTERLAARGVMRIRVAACAPTLIAKISDIAPGSCWTGEEIVIPAPPALRAAAIEVVRASGTEIRGLTAEEGRLETLYRELTGGAA